jgi:glycosyltransferase involved in cell wall biosynthesis
MGGLRTIQVANRCGIPVVMERPNAHTAFAYAAVEEECRRVGITLPDGYEHKFDAECLSREEEEYVSTDYLLCPSTFVAETFAARGFPASKLLRHQYGYDEKRIAVGEQQPLRKGGLTVLYGGLCTPRKGLHYALEAWQQSGLSESGKFLICGEFVPGYRESLTHLLTQRGIQILGHRTDLPELMQTADVFVLSSVEEGSALVTYEARGAGCVLTVSSAAGAPCRHGWDGLIHSVGNPSELASHLAELDRSREILEKLRENSIKGLYELTWVAAGRRLKNIYEEIIRTGRRNCD